MTGPRHIANTSDPRPKAKAKARQKTNESVTKRVVELREIMRAFDEMELLLLGESIALLIFGPGVITPANYALLCAAMEEYEIRGIAPSRHGPAMKQAVSAFRKAS